MTYMFLQSTTNYKLCNMLLKYSKCPIRKNNDIMATYELDILVHQPSICHLC